MTPSALPDGDPAPSDGRLPASALATLGSRPLAAYVHVPFCASRCGYCDFNTYTAADLGGAPGTSREAYLDGVAAEIALSARVLAAGPCGDPPRLASVFFGGGTPTLLSSAELGALLERLRAAFGLEADAEITTEANPDSVTPESLRALVLAGFNRISFGMQSSQAHVLRVLDRTHTPGRALEAARWAREAGFGSISLDLIYGTPGESLDDWLRSLDAALSVEPDHVSAYSLIVEDGTPLARRVRRGELMAPDDDVHADFYVAADEALTAAGLVNYETSNWARPGFECRHNLSYWRSDDWWGYGPGAHSHVGGVRWWNVKHPRGYAERCLSALGAGRPAGGTSAAPGSSGWGGSPAAGREVLSDDDRRVERVLLELRLAEGLPLDVLTASERARVPGLVAEGRALIDGDGRALASGTGPAADVGGRLKLTRTGRLLADAIVRDLVD